MAVVLEMSYAKKLGLPQFSSHSFSVSMKTEVADLGGVQAEVKKVYDTLQAAVDQQIVNPGFVPGSNGGNGHHGDNGNGDRWQCSNRQKDLILKLVDEHHLDRNEVDELARKRFGKGVTGLNKLEMSGLIDEVIEANGGTRRGNSRRFPVDARRSA